MLLKNKNSTNCVKNCDVCTIFEINISKKQAYWANMMQGGAKFMSLQTPSSLYRVKPAFMLIRWFISTAEEDVGKNAVYSHWHSMYCWIKVKSPPLFKRKWSTKERKTLH